MLARAAQAALVLLQALHAEAEGMTRHILPNYRRTHPPGYWRVVAQELRNYCECRRHETDSDDAKSVGLNPLLFEEGSCKINRQALLAHAKRPERLTVVVMAYIPEQNERLDALVCGYADADMVQKVLVLWNGLPEHRPIISCATNWRSKQQGFYRGILNPTTEVEVIVEQTNTLLNRYRHAKRVPTTSVVLQDDDVFHHAETLDAFAWGRMAAPDQILGTYPERNFRLDAATGEYEYVFHPRKTASKQYSFLLGQTSVVRRDTIDGFIRTAPRQALAFIISHKPTCEDLTFHFYNGNATGLPPIVFEDLAPVLVLGERNDQMHKQNKKLWNARRQRCLNRLAEEFGGMALVRSKCRLRGNVTRLLEREAEGERLWKYRDRAVAAAAGV